MSWNYRVVHRWVREQHIFAIHEVYYDEEERMTAVSVTPIGAQGETVKEMRDDIGLMVGALDKPVVEWDDIPEGKMARRK